MYAKCLLGDLLNNRGRPSPSLTFVASASFALTRSNCEGVFLAGSSFSLTSFQSFLGDLTGEAITSSLSSWISSFGLAFTFFPMIGAGGAVTSST